MPPMATMREIYRRHRVEYDRLVAAEDHHRNLPALLHRIADWRGRRVVEAGTGTGRVTELYAEAASQIVCFEREAHMLDAARVKLSAHSHKIEYRLGDNLDLPALPEQADLFIEGWSWGHSIVEGSGAVEAIARRLFANARRNLVGGGTAILIETLGTNQDAPGAPHPRLEEFYDLLQATHRLRQEIVRTDYLFPSAQAAAETLGFFFGEPMRQAVLERGAPAIPEWTGVWHGPIP